MPIATSYDMLVNQTVGGADVGDILLANGGDFNSLRPFKGKDGRNYVSKMVNGQPKVFLTNTPATLTRDQYKLFDDTIVKTILQRQGFTKAIRSRGLTYNIPNAMAHTVLTYPTMGDINRATVSMSPTRRGESDRPVVDTGIMPLPIIHKDFNIDIRTLLVSQNGPNPIPLDTTWVELASTKVAEEIEMMGIGTAGTFSYGGGTLYGLLTFPQRATKTDMPVPDGTNGGTVVSALATLRQLLINNRHFGPYILFVNSQWSAVLDLDFSTLKGDATLRNRLLAINNIQDIITLDFMPTTHWTCALVELSTLTIRMVVGMDAKLVQWSSNGEMEKHYKVMAMIYPQFRADTAGNSGVAIGTTVAA